MGEDSTTATLPPVPPDLFDLTPQRRSWGLAPPVWAGMTLRAWLRLLWINRFRVSPVCWPRALFVTLAASVNSLSGGLTYLLYARRIARQPVKAPLFVVGHWRSGTTLLHELLALDPRHAWPDGYACFCPAHFVRTRRILRFFLKRLIPKERPMDFMRFDMELPQEDEFGLMLLGAPSPYETLGFPRNAADRLDPAKLTPPEQARFDRLIRYFFSSVMLRQGDRRLVLKSPPHMGRLRTLARLYPDLKVLHVVRDPRAVLPSMLRMVPILRQLMRLDTFVAPNEIQPMLEVYRGLFERFEAAREVLPPGALVEVRYEDLVRDPIGVLRDIYRRLELGSFDTLEAALRPLVEAGRFRPPAAPQLTDRQRSVLEAWCAPVIERYGYR
jgi:hypothetical protein